jgi:hypothetical protein
MDPSITFTIEDPTTDPAVEPVAVEPVAEEPVTKEPVTEEPVAEEPVAEEPVTEEPVTEEPVTEPLPDPEPVPEPDPFITYLQACTGKFALLIGLNYNTLTSRISIINNVKQTLIQRHGFDELNIYTLLEPTCEELQQTIQNVMSMSNHFSELWIYYAGYGNKNFDKIMVPANATGYNIYSAISSSCCKTLCILDTCPDDNDTNYKLKWTADVYNHVKVISFCESDSLTTNKNALIQTMIQSYLQLTNNP